MSSEPGTTSGQDDVVFGNTVSGRPAELAGSENMMGLFINTLPLRVKLREGDRIIPWMKELQEDQVQMREYEQTPEDRRRCSQIR